MKRFLNMDMEVDDIKGPLSPVLTNSKSKRKKIYKKTRGKLLNKFSENTQTKQSQIRTQSPQSGCVDDVLKDEFKDGVTVESSCRAEERLRFENSNDFKNVQNVSNTRILTENKSFQSDSLQSTQTARFFNFDTYEATYFQNEPTRETARDDKNGESQKNVINTQFCSSLTFECSQNIKSPNEDVNFLSGTENITILTENVYCSNDVEDDEKFPNDLQNFSNDLQNIRSLDDPQNITHIGNDKTVQTFQAANEKNVIICENKLKNSEEEENPSKEFNTLSRNEMKISQDKLESTKNLFNNIESFDDFQNINSLNDFPSINSLNDFQNINSLNDSEGIDSLDESRLVITLDIPQCTKSINDQQIIKSEDNLKNINPGGLKNNKFIDTKFMENSRGMNKSPEESENIFLNLSQHIITRDDSIEERLKKIKQLQKSRDFIYNIRAEENEKNFQSSKRETNSRLNEEKTHNLRLNETKNQNFEEENNQNFKLNEEKKFSLNEESFQYSRINEQNLNEKLKRILNEPKNQIIGSNDRVESKDFEELIQSSNHVVGFQTAQGKKIDIGENFLNRASKFFDDIVDEAIENDFNSENNNEETLEEIKKISDVKDYESKKTKERNITGSEPMNLTDKNIILNRSKRIKNPSDEFKIPVNPDNSQENFTQFSDTQICNVIDDVELNYSTKIIKKSQTKTIKNSTTKMINKDFKESIKSPGDEFKVPLAMNKNYSPENFTQFSDSQICNAVDEAECIASVSFSQWNFSPEDKRNIKKHLNEVESKKKLREKFTQASGNIGGLNKKFNPNKNKLKNIDECLGFEIDGKIFEKLEIYKKIELSLRNEGFFGYKSSVISESIQSFDENIESNYRKSSKNSEIFRNEQNVNDQIISVNEKNFVNFEKNFNKILSGVERKSEIRDNESESFHNDMEEIKISEDESGSTKNLCNNIESVNECFSKGFQTASEKNKMKSAENLFKNINEKRKENEEKHLVDEKEIKILENKVINTENLFKNIGNVNEGFCTASRKKINISEDKLKNVENLFKNIGEIDEKFCDENIKTQKNTEIFFDKIENLNEKLSFQTASNRRIKISENKLKNAGNLFKNIENDEENISEEFHTASRREISEDKTEINAIEGFQTAGRKQIKISENKLKNAEDLFKNIEENDEEICDVKDVNVSNNNLKTKENLFNNIEETFIKGFQTASKRQIKISENKLKNAENLFKNIEENDEILNKEFCAAKDINTKNSFENIDEDDLNNEFCGANKISKECAENLFDINEGAFSIGFQTASKRQIKISENKLKNAENLFKNIEEETKITDNKLKSEENLLNNIGNVDEATFSIGFQTASKKGIKIPENKLKNAENLFKNIDEENLKFNTPTRNEIKTSKHKLKSVENLPNDIESIDIEIKSFSKGFQTANNKSINIPENKLKSARNLFDNIENEEILSKRFQTANKKQIDISENRLKNAEDLFKNIETGGRDLKNSDGKLMEIIQDDIQTKHKTKCDDLNRIKRSEETTMKKSTSSENCQSDVTTLNCGGFLTGAGKMLNIQDDTMRKIKNIFNDIEGFDMPKNSNNELNKNFDGSKTAFTPPVIRRGKTKIDENLRENTTPIIQNKLVRINCESGKNNENSPNLKNDMNTPVLQNKFLKRNDTITPVLQNKSLKHTSDEDTTPILRNSQSNVRKRRLGLSSCKQIDVSGSVKRARLIFEDIDVPMIGNEIPGSSPLNSKIINHTTPSMKPSNMTTSTPYIKNYEQSTSYGQNLTSKVSPKNSSSCNISTVEKSTILVTDPKTYLSFQESKENDYERVKKDFENEYARVRLELSVIEDRLRCLEEQQKIITSSDESHRKPNPGYLFKTKTQTFDRISLKQAVNNRRPGSSTLTHHLQLNLTNITPENALNIHFYVPWYPKNNQPVYPAVIRTLDSAIIIPNKNNYIGLSEIENSFKALKGVDPKLIPDKWIRNHFKWIVWKLASIERNYPDVFPECLSIENVMAQLKYRYDREIDKVERSAIRKILEQDDAPGKRMVLCVSDMVKTNGMFGLELTDGWYGIRCSVDMALNNVIKKGLIRIGTKLMIQGAELVNCNGCSPLEVSDSTRLQIFYNSTRRAAWYLKLGYQRLQGPLLISLRSIHNNGGIVGCTKAYVARIYPLNYMEKVDGRIVWRNDRAEGRKSNEWELNRSNLIEKIQEEVKNELMKKWEGGDGKKSKVMSNDVQNVKCPKTLFEMMENSNDPDSFKEMLTPSQNASIYEYQNRIMFERQSEMQRRLQQKLSKVNNKRNVSPVLKMLLLDIDNIYHSRVFSIWYPKESHSDIKEDNVIVLYNITPRNNNSISSVSKTHIEVIKNYDVDKFDSLRRQITPIEKTLDCDFKPQFGEFDTVGIAIYIDIQERQQNIWLCDGNSRFLSIKINETQENCYLLNNIEIGNIVAVMNLIYRKPNKNIGEALANTSTVFTTTPKKNHLKNYMVVFKKELPENLNEYIDECKSRVEVHLAEMLFEFNKLNPFCFEMDENSTAVNSNRGTIDQVEKTLSDEELSRLDTTLL